MPRIMSTASPRRGAGGIVAVYRPPRAPEMGKVREEEQQGRLPVALAGQARRPQRNGTAAPTERAEVEHPRRQRPSVRLGGLATHFQIQEEARRERVSGQSPPRLSVAAGAPDAPLRISGLSPPPERDADVGARVLVREFGGLAKEGKSGSDDDDTSEHEGKVRERAPRRRKPTRAHGLEAPSGSGDDSNTSVDDDDSVGSDQSDKEWTATIGARLLMRQLDDSAGADGWSCSGSASSGSRPRRRMRKPRSRSTYDRTRPNGDYSSGTSTSGTSDDEEYRHHRSVRRGRRSSKESEDDNDEVDVTAHRRSRERVSSPPCSDGEDSLREYRHRLTRSDRTLTQEREVHRPASSTARAGGAPRRQRRPQLSVSVDVADTPPAAEPAALGPLSSSGSPPIVALPRIPTVDRMVVDGLLQGSGLLEDSDSNTDSVDTDADDIYAADFDAHQRIRVDGTTEVSPSPRAGSSRVSDSGMSGSDGIASAAAASSARRRLRRGNSGPSRRKAGDRRSKDPSFPEGNTPKAVQAYRARRAAELAERARIKAAFEEERQRRRAARKARQAARGEAVTPETSPRSGTPSTDGRRFKDRNNRTLET